jgi:hypothetical protein
MKPMIPPPLPPLLTSAANPIAAVDGKFNPA